jgi:hypothetical protein
MKPFKISDFVKVMLYVTGRKPTINQKREVLIWHIIGITRKDPLLTEANIYDEIKRVQKKTDAQIERMFNRAMNKK